MKLNYKYVIGTHVMFYEIEMYAGFIDGLINVINTVDNKENVYFHFCFNTSQYFEKIDYSKITIDLLHKKFNDGIDKLKRVGVPEKNILCIEKTDSDKIYNVADYRRDLNYNYCTVVDYIMWGETDSFFPRESLSILESLKPITDSQNIHRYILSWSDRKMWDDSWKVTEHIDYENIKFVDSPDQFDDENYAKSFISIEKMNIINSKTKELDIKSINYPKIDGSCLVLTSDLIKSGVNIPHCLLLYGDDSSIGVVAKQILGNNFVQFIVKNILKVHARRHPKKRLYILDEDNPRGFCGDKKGKWSNVIDKYSKCNLQTIFNSQNKFYTFDDVWNTLSK